MQEHEPMQDTGLVQRAKAEFEATLHQWLLAQLHRMLTTHGASTTRPAESDGAMHHYALVSAGQCKEGAIAEMVAMHALPHERLFIRTPEAEFADIGPWLVCLPAQPGESLLHDLAHQAAQHALTVLSSPLHLFKLGEHLRRFMYGTAIDETPVLLRYFDPRIGFDVVANWQPDIRRNFMQPLGWWAGWSGFFEPQHLSGKAIVDALPSPVRILLTDQWSDAIDAVGEAHLTAALLAEELEDTAPATAEQLAQIHPLLQRHIAQDALNFVDQAQLTGWDNKALACRQALLKHARFYTHPAFKEALRQTDAAGPYALRNAMRAMPAKTAQDWARDHDAMLSRLYIQHAETLCLLDPIPNAMTRDPRTH